MKNDRIFLFIKCYLFTALFLSGILILINLAIFDIYRDYDISLITSIITETIIFIGISIPLSIAVFKGKKNDMEYEKQIKEKAKQKEIEYEKQKIEKENEEKILLSLKVKNRWQLLDP